MLLQFEWMSLGLVSMALLTLVLDGVVENNKLALLIFEPIQSQKNSSTEDPLNFWRRVPVQQIGKYYYYLVVVCFCGWHAGTLPRTLRLTSWNGLFLQHVCGVKAHVSMLLITYSIQNDLFSEFSFKLTLFLSKNDLLFWFVYFAEDTHCYIMQRVFILSVILCTLLLVSLYLMRFSCESELRMSSFSPESPKQTINQLLMTISLQDDSFEPDLLLKHCCCCFFYFS